MIVLDCPWRRSRNVTEVHSLGKVVERADLDEEGEIVGLC
jgi:hypothetical protein